jgi:tRNA modification GTPase
MSGRNTIFALATARGRAAIAVVRLSGPEAGQALKALAGALPPPRRARLAPLYDPTDHTLLDRALVLWLPGPESYTGEDSAELHIHGGPAVIAGVVSALGRLSGLRPAEAGEFTRRAFENGRLDLTAAEALADLIAAETASQRRQALDQLGGSLGKLYENWRAELLHLMALAEAEIDFPDEDVPEGVLERARTKLQSLHAAISAHLADQGRGERLRAGFQVALLGAPNVGKSSLLNALAKREVAIVSDEPGTTRDVLEAHFDLGGYPVTIADMAGLREAEGRVEAIGIARARARGEAADLRLLLVEATGTLTPPRELAKLARPDDILVATKADLVPEGDKVGHPLAGTAFIAVSALKNRGLDELLGLLEERAEAALGADEAPVISRARHRAALEECRECLDRALIRRDDFLELLAEDLRLAARALGRLTGRVDVEDILDVVFSEFCIGK